MDYFAPSFLIFILGGFLILLSWDVNVTGLTVSATVLVGIFGFAAQDTLANLFAGFFIMLIHPISLVTISIWMGASGAMLRLLVFEVPVL